MTQTTKLSEVWVQLHYRYRNESYKYNLPLPDGSKTLDGVKVDFDRKIVPGGQRFLVTMESRGLVDIESFVLTGSLDYSRDLKGIFVNGYQSWTESNELYPGERIAALNSPGRLLSLQRSGDASFYPYSERKGRFHGYSYAYLRYPDRLFLVCSLDDSIGYTIIGTDIRQEMFTLTKDLSGYRLNGKQKILDLAILEGMEDAVFSAYADMRGLSDMRFPRVFSWISEPSGTRRLDELYIRRNLAVFRDNEIPLDYFIIGSGWQSALGEWKLLASGFPSGMSSLCAEIRGSGYRPGLWFAPFVVGVDSTIFRTRKDWLIREPGKALKPAGRFAQHRGAVFALDLSRQDVREYIAESYQRITEKWRYDFIALDLLYVTGIYPRDGLSRAGAMYDAMKFLTSLKDEATTWLVNGVPLEPCFGKVEYTRICANTSPAWEHTYHKSIHLRERVSTLSALRSTVGRRHLNGRLSENATGPFHLKSTRKSMDESQRYTQLLLCLLFGSFISTSDPVGDYQPETMRLFMSLFPFINPLIESVTEFRRTIRVNYKVGGRTYLSISNLAERTRSYQLPDGNWFVAAAGGNHAHHIMGGKHRQIKSGESHNYLLLEEGDCFAGSDGHIFPGTEIKSIQKVDNNWVIIPEKSGLNLFKVWLRVPADDANTTINGYSVEKEILANGECLISTHVGDSPAV